MVSMVIASLDKSCMFYCFLFIFMGKNLIFVLIIDEKGLVLFWNIIVISPCYTTQCSEIVMHFMKF